MFQRISLIQTRQLFFLAQIIVFVAAILILFCLMFLNQRSNILHSLMSKLETATDLMADQLKINQVPSSNVGGDYSVFIINQSDGTMVIDRKEENKSLELWEAYRTKLIYEMQKAKHGWIVYPDKISWNLSQEQKIIRYISIDELHWILAMESSRPTELEILKQFFNIQVLLPLFSVLLIGTALFWLMTIKYFQVLKDQIANNVENNLMSLSGEESMLNKFQTSTTAHSKEEPIEFVPSSSTQERHSSFKEPVVEPLMPIADERESFLEKKPNIVNKKSPKELDKPKESPLDIKKDEPEAASSLDQLTIDVGSIKSPTLRKMIKKFREK